MKTHCPEEPHPADIKAMVQKAGGTLAQIARDAGLPEWTCRYVLYRPNERGERAVAAFLRMSPQELWPSRYEPDGTRRRHLYSSRVKHTAPQHGAERQNSEAA